MDKTSGTSLSLRNDALLCCAINVKQVGKCFRDGLLRGHQCVPQREKGVQKSHPIPTPQKNAIGKRVLKMPRERITWQFKASRFEVRKEINDSHTKETQGIFCGMLSFNKKRNAG